MVAMASQNSSFTIVYSTIYSGGDKKKHQSSALLAFVQGIHHSPVNSPHKCNAENVSIWLRHHVIFGVDFIQTCTKNIGQQKPALNMSTRPEEVTSCVMM